MNRIIATVLCITSMAQAQFWGNDGFPEVMNWDRFRALTEGLGLSQAQINGLLPAHDAYVQAFREIVEDDFADFVEKDDDDGKYQWSSADPELAASFRTRRSQYRNLCDELEEAEDELFDLASAYLTETQRLQLEDVRARRERERLRAQTWPGFEWNFGGAMGIEAQDLLTFSELEITEAMVATAAKHSKNHSSATEKNAWTPSKTVSIASKQSPTLMPWWIQRSPKDLARSRESSAARAAKAEVAKAVVVKAAGIEQPART